MVGVEARRCVAAVRTAHEVAARIVVLGAHEVTLRVVVVDVGVGARAVNDGSAELLVVIGEEFRLGAAQVVIFFLIVLVTDHQPHVVLAEGLVVVQNLLKVVGDVAGVVLRNRTARLGELTVILVVEIGRAGFVDVGAAVYRQLQPLVKRDVHEAAARKGVALGLFLVEPAGLQSVGAGQQRTGQTRIALVAVVVHLIAVVVHHDAARTVADVYRVDRGHLCREREDVGRRGSRSFVRVAVAVAEVRIRHVAAHLQPLLGLIIGLQTRGIALQRRTFDNTRIVQITERSVERAALRRTGDVHVVFLTERRLVSLVDPVVGRQPILLSVVDDLAAQRRVRIQLAVGADQRLPFGNRIDVVSQTARAVGSQAAAGQRIGLRRRIGLRIIAVERLEMRLVILRGRGDHVVLLQRFRVYAPLGVDRHDGVARLRLFGGDHNHAVGAAGAVQSVRSGVLEDGHRLDVVRVQVVQVAFIGHAVHNPERLLAGVDRTETADADRGGLAEISRRAGGLHTGHAADQSRRHVGGLHLGNLIRFYDGSRTGESLFLCRTEGHDDHIVDRLRILLHRDVDPGFSGDRQLLRLKTDKRHHERAVHRSRKRILAGRVGRGPQRGPIYNDGRACNRMSVCIGNCTGDLPILGRGICQEHEYGN